MKKLLLVFVLTSSFGFSQDFITLNTVPFEAEDSSFYVKEVIDARDIKNLGMHHNLNGERVILKLGPEAPDAIMAFMNRSLIQTPNKKGIYLKINTLNLQNTRRNAEEIVSRATVDLSFCEKKKGHLKELFRVVRNEDQVFAASILGFTKTIEDEFKSHEQRIRAALEYAVLAFMEYQQDSAENYVTHFESSSQGEAVSNSLNRWYNIIEYRQILTSTYHKGWALGYTGFLDNNKSFIIPYELNLEFYDVKEDFARREGFEFVDATMLRPGIFGYKKVFPGVYGAVGINVPLGFEVKRRLDTDDDIYKFLIGIGASQGLKIIPWKKYGMVLGIEFFQQIQNSEIFTRDVGLEFSVGFNF